MSIYGFVREVNRNQSKNTGLGLRYGVVASVETNSVTVTIGGEDVDECVPLNGFLPAVNDVVACLVTADDVLVLGGSNSGVPVGTPDHNHDTAYAPLAHTHTGADYTYAVTEQTEEFVLTADMNVAAVSCSTGFVLVHLPSAVGLTGHLYVVKKMDATVFPVIVAATGVETIDGATEQSLTEQYEALSIVSTGTEWIII